MKSINDIAQVLFKSFEQRKSVPKEEFIKPIKLRNSEYQESICEIQIIEARCISRLFDLTKNNLSTRYIDDKISKIYNDLYAEKKDEKEALSYIEHNLEDMINNGKDWQDEVIIATPLSPCSMAEHVVSIGPFTIEEKQTVESRQGKSTIS